MPRNGSGTYTLPQAAFVPGTTISSTAVNSDFSDIATALTGSIAADGQTPILAPLKQANGTLGAPTWTFNNDTTAGLYLPSAGVIGLVVENFGLLINTTASEVLSATISAAGSNYAVGDTITLTGGTAIKQAVLTVATLSGTGIATVTITDGGNYSATPSNPVSQGSTSGLGSGATFTLTYTVAFSISLPSGQSAWVGLGASNYMSAAMAQVSGLALANYIGASNLATAIGVSGAPPGSFKKLSIKVATNTTVALVADFIVVTNGSAFQTLAYNQTINLGTTGANALDTGSIAIDTWYYIWAIAQPNGTVAGLASTSSTTPTMPSGYTYKARVGAVQTIHASATLYGTWQLGRRAQYVVGLAQTANLPIAASGSSGSVSVPTYSAVSLVRYIPTTASEAFGVMGAPDNNATGIIAPNSSYGALTSSTNPPPAMITGASGVIPASTPWSFLLESTNIYYAATGADTFIGILGWVDNL